MSPKLIALMGAVGYAALFITGMSFISLLFETEFLSRSPVSVYKTAALVILAAVIVYFFSLPPKSLSATQESVLKSCLAGVVVFLSLPLLALVWELLQGEEFGVGLIDSGLLFMNLNLYFAAFSAIAVVFLMQMWLRYERRG